MSRSLKKLKDTWNFYRISIVKRSSFYRYSLSKKHNIFDVDKFITDPWAGDSKMGRYILDHGIISKYADSFMWIRDVQAIGGNNSRKYVRNSILSFINDYRKKKNFWLEEDSWDYAIIGERIVNWIFSYSFFATGASDKFQKEVLSSISEQFSHLLKCYKAENNPYSRLMALKAIIFCLCCMKTVHQQRIRKILNDVNYIIDTSINGWGMFRNRSPSDHFHMFRSILEIKFIVKSSGIDLPYDTFSEKLSKMASVVRFLRLGDGGISEHSGDCAHSKSIFIPSPNMIDTALSIVEVKPNETKPFGFDRLETKKSVIIINTRPCNAKSKFNSPSEPGINIFDFEASFGADRLINRADISVVFNGFRIKLDEKAKVFTEKTLNDNKLLFEGETQFSNKFLKFAMKREIELHSNKPQIDCTDFVLISTDAEVYFRFVFNTGSEINRIDKNTVAIFLGKSEYLFKVSIEDIQDIDIMQKSEESYPSIEIRHESNQREVEFNWSLQCMK